MEFVRTALRHAVLAYRDPANVQLLVGESGGRVLAILDDQVTGAHGHVASLVTGEILIAFRGSEVRLNDWRTNCSSDLIADSVGCVHHGFRCAFASIEDHLWDALQDVRDVPVVLCGHSLGGAIAIIAAKELHRAGCIVRQVHTFGSPRVGNSAWCYDYDLNLRDVTYRHVYCCDVVPRLPTVTWHYYAHVGVECYYDCWGGVHENCPAPLKWLDRILARIQHWGKLPTRGIADHYLDSYRNAIRGIYP